MIGKLERVPLREVWKHEALDFTCWLTEHPEVLGEAIGLTLREVEREGAAGNFIVDMRAKDEDGNVIVIENQLERSNHDHLGKLITYVAAIEATVAIWIVSDPRPEHVAAINWLNQLSNTAFFLLKVEAVRIGVSQPAPLLTLITGPSEETRAAGEKKKDNAARHDERRQFWTELLERSKGRTRLFSTVSPRATGDLGTGSGLSLVWFNYVVWQDEAAVELYIATDDAAYNRALFDLLHADREAIERDFGEELEWEPLEAKKACRIRKTIGIGGYRTPETRTAVQDAMIDAMIRLDKTLRPKVAQARILAPVLG